MHEPSQEVDALANRIIGAAIEVHKHLGPGYLENVYEEAVCVELGLRKIPFLRQKAFAVEYKGISVGEGRTDLLVDDVLIVELKAVTAFAPIHTAQAISYLKAMKKDLALLINFNVHFLKDGIKRVVAT